MVAEFVIRCFYLHDLIYDYYFRSALKIISEQLYFKNGNGGDLERQCRHFEFSNCQQTVFIKVVQEKNIYQI